MQNSQLIVQHLRHQDEFADRSQRARYVWYRPRERLLALGQRKPVDSNQPGLHKYATYATAALRNNEYPPVVCQ